MTYLTNIKKFILDDILRFTLLFLFIFQYSNLYRVAMRCLYEGGDFQWMQTWGVSLLGDARAMRIMGNGLEGHFLIILLLALLFTVAVFGLIRRSDDPLSKFLVLAFTGVMVIKEIMLSIAFGDQYTIAGETFRLNLDYSILGPVFSILIFSLAIWWVVRDRTSESVPGLSVKTNWMAGALSIPCFLLLRLGEQHDWTDMAGVSFIYMQFTILLLNWMGIFQSKDEYEMENNM